MKRGSKMQRRANTSRTVFRRPHRHRTDLIGWQLRVLTDKTWSESMWKHAATLCKPKGARDLLKSGSWLLVCSDIRKEEAHAFVQLTNSAWDCCSTRFRRNEAPPNPWLLIQIKGLAKAQFRDVELSIDWKSQGNCIILVGSVRASH